MTCIICNEYKVERKFIMACNTCFEELRQTMRKANNVREGYKLLTDAQKTAVCKSVDDFRSDYAAKNGMAN